MRVSIFERGRRLAAVMGVAVVATAAAGAGVVGAVPADPGGRPAFCRVVPQGVPGLENLCAVAGDLLDVRIGDVLATQPSLGYDEVYYKLGRYTLGKDKVNKKFDDWCEANGQGTAASVRPDARLSDPASFQCTIALGQETAASIEPMKTVVIGPGGRLYLTDGHHTLTSFFELGDGGPNLHVRLRVLDNFATLAEPEFWARMQANKWVWLADVDGNPVAVQDLPKSVGMANFADDKYRSLMYFARDIGYRVGEMPFQEFYWGKWLRESGAVDQWRDDAASYLDAVRKVTLAQTALAPSAIVTDGATASELGAMTAWNDGKPTDQGEFGKLAEPYTDDTPGKLAYALEYRARQHH